MRRLLTVGLLVTAATGLLLARPAHAATGDCRIATVDRSGRGTVISAADVEAAASSTHPIHVSAGEQLRIAGTVGSRAPITAAIKVFGITLRTLQATGGNGVVVAEVDDVTRWGTGRYLIEVSGGCTGTVFVVVDGTTLTKPVFLGAIGLALLGLALLVLAIRARAVVRAVLAGLLAGVGIAVAWQQLGGPATAAAGALIAAAPAAFGGITSSLRTGGGRGRGGPMSAKTIERPSSSPPVSAEPAPPPASAAPPGPPGPAAPLPPPAPAAVAPLPPPVAAASPPRAPSEARYLGAWFADPAGERPVPADRCLAALTPYALQISLGPQQAASVISGPAFPDLPPEAGGHWLTASVISEELRDATDPDLRALQATTALFLPLTGAAFTCRCEPGGAHSCAPAERRSTWSLAVQTPGEGAVKARVLVHHRGNLVQSAVVLAAVGPREAPGHPMTGEIDYTLTDGLVGLDQLASRRLSIVTNDDPGATHTIAVHAGADGATVGFTLGEAQLEDAIGAARSALYAVHIEQRGGGAGASGARINRYRTDNSKDRKGFEDDLRSLVPLGRRLWDVLFVDQRDAGRDLVRRVLDEPGTIQVARAGRSGLVFPWALVYDLPIQLGSPQQWRFCAVVEQLFDGTFARAPLPTQCPHANDHGLDVLCPFGFWGLHHVIEEPPSMPKGRTLPSTVTMGAPPGTMVVAISQDLNAGATAAHLERLGRVVAPLALLRADDKQAIQDDLARTALEFVYFYCHGQRAELAGASPQPRLGVGKGEVLDVGDLSAWYEALWPDDHWRTTSPLVFINGCHTAEISPRTLVEFVDTFAGIYASGVIGTEITLDQAVASEAGELVWGGLRRGDGVGDALRSMRLALLLKGNLMGLAYTAYCSADLHLEPVPA